VRNWRVLTAVAAVVLAALAGVLVWKYTDNAKQDAKKPFDFKTVLVAHGAISQNTSFATALEQHLIERNTEFLAKNVPPSAIDASQPDDTLAKAYGPLIAGHAIADGAPLVRSDFVAVGSASAGGLSGTLSNDASKLANKNDAQAISINLDDTHGVGGFVNPGDRINILLSVPYKNDNKNASPTAKITGFLLAGAKVLAVGSNTTNTQQAVATASGSTTPTTSVTTSRSVLTVEVTSRQAEMIAQAQFVGGTFYASLLPGTFKPWSLNPGDIQEIVNTDNLYDQGLDFSQGLLDAIKNNHN